MKPMHFRWARPVALLAAVALAGSCGLPKVGPSKRQIFAGSVQKQGDAFVVSVNDNNPDIKNTNLTRIQRR